MQIQNAANRTPARQASPIEAKCPHGSMPGACPACSGGGGGGGAKRASGLMTWNEAYALWKSIQVGQARQADYFKGVTDNQQRLQQQAAAGDFRTMLAASLARFLHAAAQAMANFMHVLSAPGRAMGQLAAAVQQGFAQAQGRFAQVLNRMIDISDKLATILGDAKKLLDDLIHHNLEVFKQLLSRFLLIERLAQIESLVGKVFRQFFNGEIFRSATRRIRNLFAKIKGWFGRRDEEESAGERSA